MRKTIVALVCLLAETAVGQRLERTIWLFDSFPDLGHANVFFENPVTQRIYFAGRPCGRINVYDPGAGAKFGYYDSARRCIAVAHCPEAHRVWFCAYTDGALAAFDDRADTLVQMVKDVVRNPAALVYSPGMSKLYVGSNGAALVLPCDAATGEVLDSVSVPWRVTCMVYDSLRNRLYVSGREWDTSAAVVVECVGDSVIANIPGTTHMSDMVLSPDLSRLYCLCVQDSVERNVVRIVDLDSLAVTDSIVIPLSGGWPLWGRLMPDFEHGVMWTGRVDPFQTCEDVRDTLAVIDVSGDSLLTLVGLHSGFGASCFAVNSSEGKLYLTPSLWDSLAIVRPDGSLRYADIPSPRAPGVVWSRAYNRAFVVGEDDTVLVYDAAGDTLVGLVDYAGLVVDWASWNPGSRRLYVGNRDGVGWLLGDTLGEWCPFHLSGASTLLAYLPELDRLYLGGRRDTVPCVVVYDCGADSVVAVAALPERVDCALPLPDHQKMYVALGRGDSAAVYDMSSDSVVGFVDLEGRSLMEYNRCADLVYACSTGSDGVVAIIDPEIDSVVGLVSLPPIWDLGVNERDNELWVLTQHDTLLVIDCESNQHVDTILLPPIVGWNPEVCIVDEDSKAYCLGAATADVVDCQSRRLVASFDLGEFNRADPKAFYNPLSCKLYLSGHDYRPRRCMRALSCRGDSVVAAIEIPVTGWTWDSVENETYCYYGKQISVLKDDAIGIRAESSRPRPEVRAPTVVRRVLSLPRTSTGALLDVAGRRVMDLQPGENDIRHIAPGVYFVHQPTADSRQLTAVRKVVIQK